ncbi:hypothetical protein K493DRAFT_302736 [Basidiobolus meristosporus CBS 931.73]|uniref:Uncharacterized protein n=1 Tax=Basidiobolus meristosporus CBS 931.73 TaxID=1314790 RepID=A0A1Y1Y5R6_9FUNG|nr:hypothetical protein K493DRAFT_302736 [Basidiobolus meristosporus CBS 931.73]|eukprot:ORX93370.1 hypothetical protein K493DRAFT_302736 [Basidiobolus meristosporus CBS 931.73]
MCSNLNKVTQIYSKDIIEDVLQRTESHDLVTIAHRIPDCKEVAVEELERRLRMQRLHITLEQGDSKQILTFELVSIDDQYATFESRVNSLPILLHYNTIPTKVIAIHMEYEKTNLLFKSAVVDIKDIDVKCVSQNTSWQLVYEVDSESPASEDRVVLPRSFECQLEFLFANSREAANWSQRVRGWFKTQKLADISLREKEIHYKLFMNIS